MQIHLRNWMRSEVNIVNSVGDRRSQSYPVTCKGSADMIPVSAKRDLPIHFYSSGLVSNSVLDRRQLLRKRSRARLITTRRHLHIQSFMRPNMIVAVAPVVKSTLHALKVGEHSLGQHFSFQTAMKALVLSLRLRMIRAAMRNRDAETQQPNRQRRELMQEAAAPRRPIVHQHALGQSITPKDSRQLLLHSRSLLIATGLETKCVTRMIIQHRQRMTLLMSSKAKVSLKIHLPEPVRSLVFKSSIRTHSLFRRMRHQLMTQQDRVYCAFGQPSFSGLFQTRLDLACTPSVFVANRQHFFFDVRRAASRRMLRSPRTIGQTRDPLFSIPSPPLVT